MCKELLEESDVEKLLTYQMYSYSLVRAAGGMMTRHETPRDEKANFYGVCSLQRNEKPRDQKAIFRLCALENCCVPLTKCSLQQKN